MKQRWKVLLVTSVAVFMGFLDVTIVNIAFPDIEASFPGTSLAGLSWILNAYNIVFAALLVPAGRLSDRLGRRRMFFVGVSTFLAASAVCGLAPSVEVLVAARVVQAAGAAILVPTSLALLLPEFPLEQRATATALWGATGGIAAATGPALGGVLVDGDELALGLLRQPRHRPAGADPGAAAAAREPRRATRPAPGHRSASCCSSPASGCSRWASSRARTGAGAARRVVGSLVASALVLAAFVARSARHPAPVIELGLLRVRSFAVANAGVFLFALGFYAVLLANILFLTGVWGWSVLRAGHRRHAGPAHGRPVGRRRRAASPTATASASSPSPAGCSSPPAASSSPPARARRRTTPASSCPRRSSPAPASA